MEFITVGVIVTMPWNKNVPMITFVMEALLTVAPPIRMADTAGRAYVEPLAKAAIAVGADGLMIEVHPNPACALSDGPQSLTFDAFEKLMADLKPFCDLAGRTVTR